MSKVLSRRRHLWWFGRVQSVKPSEDDITSLPVALSGPLPGCWALIMDPTVVLSRNRSPEPELCLILA